MTIDENKNNTTTFGDKVTALSERQIKWFLEPEKYSNKTFSCADTANLEKIYREINYDMNKSDKSLAIWTISPLLLINNAILQYILDMEGVVAKKPTVKEVVKEATKKEVKEAPIPETKDKPKNICDDTIIKPILIGIEIDDDLIKNTTKPVTVDIEIDDDLIKDVTKPILMGIEIDDDLIKDAIETVTSIDTLIQHVVEDIDPTINHLEKMLLEVVREIKLIKRKLN